MSYKLSKQSGDSVAIPQLIISRLQDTEDDWIRVALYVVSTGVCNAKIIAQALRLKNEHKAQQALLFWKGAGLIENSTEQDGAAQNPLQSSEKENTEQKKHVHLTTQEVTGIATKDSNIAFLAQECQRLTGGIVTQSDINIFVSMYIVDEMPIDMILLGVAHFSALGKKNARYIERAMLSWQREGITTYTAAEHYLKNLEKQEEFTKRALVALGLEEIKPSKAERLLMCTWFEQYGYVEDIITEAAAVAKEKKNIKYVNGILRRWHEQGYKTLADVIRQSNLNMQNISVSNESAKSVLSGKMRPVPSFKPKGESAK